MNTIWYIFSILFVLYKYTSFFSYTYNFIKFCGNIYSGIVWTKDKISDYLLKRKGHIRLGDDNEHVLPERNVQYRSYFSKFKELIGNTYNTIKTGSSNMTDNSQEQELHELPNSKLPDLDLELGNSQSQLPFIPKPPVKIKRAKTRIIRFDPIDDILELERKELQEIYDDDFDKRLMESEFINLKLNAKTHPLEPTPNNDLDFEK